MKQRHLFDVMSTTQPDGTQADGAPPQPAWAEVYLAEAQRLTRLATVLVGPADAHDLVVDTVHRVVNERGWESIAEPGAYLTRCLVNAANSMKRSDRRRTAREERAGRLTIVSAVDTTSRVDVQRALRRLTPQQRAIAYFVYWEDQTIPQVAIRLDVSQGTVRKQLARAKDRLREVLR